MQLSTLAFKLGIFLNSERIPGLWYGRHRIKQVDGFYIKVPTRRFCCACTCFILCVFEVILKQSPRCSKLPVPVPDQFSIAFYRVISLRVHTELTYFNLRWFYHMLMRRALPRQLQVFCLSYLPSIHPCLCVTKSRRSIYLLITLR